MVNGFQTLTCALIFKIY